MQQMPDFLMDMTDEQLRKLHNEARTNHVFDGPIHDESEEEE